MANKKKGRGLASASSATRKRVAEAGGKAKHRERGLQAASRETRQRVSSMGGKQRGKNMQTL